MHKATFHVLGVKGTFITQMVSEHGGVTTGKEAAGVEQGNMGTAAAFESRT